MKEVFRVSCLTLVAVLVCVGITLTAQNRFAVKSPNGITFSEFRGYDTWQIIAPSAAGASGCARPAPCIKAIVGNAVMMKAYADGIPANGKAVPDGAAMAKIEWATVTHAAPPYAVDVPAQLNTISFMLKDAKRFPDTDGWGYAQFRYDPATKTFTPRGDGPAFAKATCHQCHIAGAKATNFVFTRYAAR